ncbi:hypothetical protein AYO22_03424 [Fonsecaea multimorphosa]|nr:hypothetical protein AYO22_03424 [Fonsecaea multimorphosa]
MILRTWRQWTQSEIVGFGPCSPTHSGSLNITTKGARRPTTGDEFIGALSYWGSSLNWISDPMAFARAPLDFGSRQRQELTTGPGKSQNHFCCYRLLLLLLFPALTVVGTLRAC